MRLLLDTDVVPWAIADDPRLGPESRRLIEDDDCVRFVSAASIWEAKVKSAIGKLANTQDLRIVLANNGVEPLDITWFHAQTAGRLPLLHRDHSTGCSLRSTLRGPHAHDCGLRNRRVRRCRK